MILLWRYALSPVLPHCVARLKDIVTESLRGSDEQVRSAFSTARHLHYCLRSMYGDAESEVLTHRKDQDSIPGQSMWDLLSKVQRAIRMGFAVYRG